MKKHNEFIEKLLEFETTFKNTINVQPCEEAFKKTALLRCRLMLEELGEFNDSLLEFVKAENKEEEAYGLIGMVDGLTDLLYVVIGTAVVLGIDIEESFKEVHRSNMSKLNRNGEPIFRDDGKILKGRNYTPPELERFVDVNERGEYIFV